MADDVLVFLAAFPGSKCVLSTLLAAFLPRFLPILNIALSYFAETTLFVLLVSDRSIFLPSRPLRYDLLRLST